MANDAIDIFDPAAADTLGVMMVVGDARLVTSAGRVRQTDASDQSVPGQVLHDQMHGLQRDGGKSATDGLKDRVRVGVRLMMQMIQHCNALTGGPKSVRP